jgi:hypothetical protein
MSHNAGLESAPFTSLTCGFTRTPHLEGAKICGAPATWHVWVGPFVEPAGPDSFIHWSCDAHLHRAIDGAFDWHHVGGACGIEGSLWHTNGVQGIGYCIHELDQLVAVSELLGVSVDAINANLALQETR